MGVKQLPNDQGMLFVFPSKQATSFWGKDTYIPLDIAFVSGNEIVQMGSIVPMSTRPIRPNFLCNHAIEANAGWFKANDIKVGDKIEVTKEDGQNVIVFSR